MQSPQSVPCWSSWSEEPSHSCRCRPLPLAPPCPTWCRWQWNSLYALLRRCKRNHRVRGHSFWLRDEYLGMHFVICGRRCIVGYTKFVVYLQWTTIGPAEGGLEILTLRMKESSPVAWYGTPWSGQPVKWNCLTSRTSLKPRWVEIEHIFSLHFIAPVKFLFNSRFTNQIYF